jgi:hypothetical protein
MGTFGVSKDGTKLICCFPTSQVIAALDMADDIKVGGLTHYVRYSCKCGGHMWAYFEAYHDERTTFWCVDLKPDTSKKGQKMYQKAPAPAAHPHPEFFKELFKELGIEPGSAPVVIMPPGTVQDVPANALLAAPMGKVVDHESRENLLKLTMPFTWRNWASKTPFSLLPGLPERRLGHGTPLMVVGGDNKEAVEAMTNWLISLAVDIDELRNEIAAFVYWGNFLIVVSNATDCKRILDTLSGQIAQMKRQRPVLWFCSPAEYEDTRKLQQKKKKK